MSNSRILNALADGLIALKKSAATFGLPRPIASSETDIRTYREVTVGEEKFRVLTLEDQT